MYNALSGAAYFLIRFFQIVISPQDGPSCRFKPVCSVYGRIAIQRFGALPGAMLAGDRILRCNPISPPGEDPVPYTIFGE
ncbi:MAG: membrane protein insertion efficiency factor YidD [Spirochaetota bacterium]|nr:membrane protein insertion efficiency factor YidD [Spirochaetota bacterium]